METTEIKINSQTLSCDFSKTLILAQQACLDQWEEAEIRRLKMKFGQNGNVKASSGVEINVMSLFPARLWLE